MRKIMDSRTFYVLALYVLLLRGNSEWQLIPDTIAAITFALAVVNCIAKRRES